MCNALWLVKLIVCLADPVTRSKNVCIQGLWVLTLEVIHQHSELCNDLELFAHYNEKEALAAKIAVFGRMQQ